MDQSLVVTTNWLAVGVLFFTVAIIAGALVHWLFIERYEIYATDLDDVDIKMKGAEPKSYLAAKSECKMLNLHVMAAEISSFRYNVRPVQ